MPLFNPPYEYRVRVGVEPVGTKDGLNAVFTLPEPSVDPEHVELFHNGRRLLRSSGSLLEGEYVVTETTPGDGYDRITFLSFRPSPRSELRANFVIP